ncbi:hypothetical protein QYE76_066425 [Lolium multiflorum]|uniref:Integrase catalytic domain-containing protein n=1 Tax=Lolium multiflorum TaxID=4521 RepID=A0AAD8WAQ7_LOLMU|nr:hypothetical protein QYE76_066425 [Lolium multiflorum]
MYESEIKAIRTDNGTEFKNYTMQEFVDDEGIKHEFSAPYTPHQNGVVERKNRTIIEMARTMLSEFNSPQNFWGEAISTVVHYSNRLFLRPLHNKTPYELLTGNKPNVMYIRVFGCKCLVKNNKGNLGKFETRTIEGTFVGYAENSHTYRYYNKSIGAIEVSCDVVFLEDNGSQVEQVVPCAAGDDDPSNAIKLMGIGHIRPTEVHTDDQSDEIEVSSSAQVEPSSTQAEPSSATQEPSSTQDESHSEEQEEIPHPTEQDHDDDQETSSTHVQAQVVPHDRVLARNEFIDHEGTIRKIKAALRASDLKVDQVLGSISRGVGVHEEWCHCDVKAINKEVLTMHQATKYRFVVDTLQQMGLFDLVCLQPGGTKGVGLYCPILVRPFHCTVFFHDDPARTITWMTGQEKYTCNYVDFCEAMGFGGGRAHGFKIHSQDKFTHGDIAFCYPPEPTTDPPTISGMYYSYFLLAKLFRENLISKSGDTSECRAYHLNLMYYFRPENLKTIDGCDFLYYELRRSVRDCMTPNYAQYIQQLINRVVPTPNNKKG